MATNILVGTVLVLSIICTYFLIRLFKRGVWRRGHVFAPLAVTVVWTVWATVALIYRNLYAGGSPSLFVSTFGASVQMFSFAVFALILWSLNNEHRD